MAGLSFISFQSAIPNVRSRGQEALSSGSVGIVTLAAGVGSRWTQGAGCVKALHPFCSIGGGKHRNFIDVHLAKNRKVSSDVGMPIPHVFTTSWMTHEAIHDYVQSLDTSSLGPIHLSKGGECCYFIIVIQRSNTCSLIPFSP